MHPLHAVILAAFSLALPRLASADAGSPGIALAHLELPGTFEVDRPVLERQIVQGLRAAGFDVAAPEESRLRMEVRPDLASCTAGACLADVERNLGTSRFVRGKIASARGYFRIDLLVLDGTGAELAAESRECRAADPCGSMPEEIAQVAKAVGRRALAEIEAAIAREDLRRRMAPPRPPPVAPKADPTLIAPADASPSPTLPRWAPWTFVGTGAALLVTSGVLFAMDGDVKQRLASGPKNYWDTAGWGIATGVLGLAAAGAGGYLLVRDHGTRVALLPGGAALQGRF